MSIKGTLLLYISSVLIISSLLFLALFETTAISFAEDPFMAIVLSFSLIGGFILFGIWLLANFIAAVVHLASSVPFLSGILSGEGEKRLLLAQAESKKQSELLEKLAELNSDKSLSDDELDQKTLTLFQEYGVFEVETNQ